MKLKSILALGLLSTSLFATHIYNENGQEIARMDEADSKALYDALDIKAIKTKGGWVKVFAASDDKARVYCVEHSTSGSGRQSHTCHLTIGAIR